MRRPVVHEAPSAPWGLLLVAIAAALLLAAVLVVLRGPASDALAGGGVAPLARAVATDAAIARVGLPAFGSADARASSELAAPLPAPAVRVAPAESVGPAEGVAPAPGAAPGTVSDVLALEVDRTALLAPVIRASTPGRHEAIATRLGWAPGDGRRDTLASWLQSTAPRRDDELVRLFGPRDAGAIAQDLASTAIAER
jgi:hypothetical protein